MEVQVIGDRKQSEKQKCLILLKEEDRERSSKYRKKSLFLLPAMKWAWLKNNKIKYINK